MGFTQPRRRGQKNWKAIFLTVFLILVLVAGGAAFYVRRAYNQNLEPISKSQKVVPYTVPKGASVQEVATDLEDQGLIRAAWAFEWYFRNHGLLELLQAGTYNLRPNMAVSEMADLITSGNVATDLVTIPPGMRIDQIRSILIDRYGFSAKSVDQALKPGNYAGHAALVDKPKSAGLEGYLYPESFQKTAETSPQMIIASSLDQMQKNLTPELRRGIVRQGLTVHEGVILASIIEQEVSDENAGDKRNVAQIFLKRLREGINLQSDATAGYGAVLDGKAGSLTRDQILIYESPYNTYNHGGLPPTPISNVSLSSLEAVANPGKGDYLYFVSGDDGKTYFSRTIEEHDAAVQQHCTRLCQ
jgi:UPF0755 protein